MANDTNKNAGSKTDILIGISSCLLGERVRYDGGHKYNPYIDQTLGRVFSFRPFCPEMEIGLGVPRPTIKLIATDSGTRCVDTKTGTQDFTERLQQTADDQQSWHSQVFGYIFKNNSPSCGTENVRVETNSKKSHSDLQGRGIYAARFMDNFPLIPAINEEQLGDAELRENFIQQVYSYYRWRQLKNNPSSL